MSKLLLMSLSDVDYQGWMTKQGGSFKNWKRRWFVLKGPVIYYFKSNAPETEVQGQIDLTSQSFVRQEFKHGKKQAFAVATQKRIFFMYADQDEESAKWMSLISKAIDNIQEQATSKASSAAASDKDANGSAKAEISFADKTANVEEASEVPASMSSAAASLKNAIKEIPFLRDGVSKVSEFCKVWFQTILTLEEQRASEPYAQIEYQAILSANMQKITWCTSGLQNVLIQKMVDFFWNVGAPEGEIDCLNEVGSMMNPPIIGFWIDISQDEGMDGGWYFPSSFFLEQALDAADPCESTHKILEWAESQGITNCVLVGRDMGAAPPRQTQIHVQLSKDTMRENLDIALSASRAFGFPDFDTPILDFILSSNNEKGIKLSLVSCRDGFVKIGIIVPISPSSVDALCSLAGVDSSAHILKFSSVLGHPAPNSVEFQFLNQGFGYGVYKEGVDINFYFAVGGKNGSVS
ncbi:PH domain-containing protein DDB_G0274775-like [Schistocerca gregaria]|uniref:PH domain-containing protein DDB_G0274775-like n=1 Tax=Schistocerca gregaria TaxID=7010 RepID=UPI00211EB5CA|nr:PH domain-containing protein DDB_G0274775-like [Schistocerca gregaria]